MCRDLKPYFIYSALLLCILACQNQSTDQAYKEMIINYVDGYNSLDVEKMVIDLHDDISFEDIKNGQASPKSKGIKEFKLLAEETIIFFSERKQTVKSWTFHEGNVQIEVDYFGVLGVDVSDKLSSGDTIRISGKSEFLFKDNKIIRIRDEN